jgi:hypothetical protein
MNREAPPPAPTRPPTSRGGTRLPRSSAPTGCAKQTPRSSPKLWAYYQWVLSQLSD